MDPAELAPNDAAYIRSLLLAARIDDSYLAFVARHLDVDDEQWRWCCGSNCDPCVKRLASVVDAARQTLCKAPRGGGGDPGTQ